MPPPQDGPTVRNYATSTVKIKATSNTGYVFKEWTVTSGDAVLEDRYSAETTFTRTHCGDVRITAVFVEAPIATETPESTPETTPTYPPVTLTPNPYKPGDINCDNAVNIDDILLVRDIIFGQTPTPAQLEQITRINPLGKASIDVILAVKDIIFGG